MSDEEVKRLREEVRLLKITSTSSLGLRQLEDLDEYQRKEIAIFLMASTLTPWAMEDVARRISKMATEDKKKWD